MALEQVGKYCYSTWHHIAALNYLTPIFLDGMGAVITLSKQHPVEGWLLTLNDTEL